MQYLVRGVGMVFAMALVGCAASVTRSDRQVRERIVSNSCLVVTSQGSGSGTFLHDNLVLTAYHVVDSFPFEAIEVVGTDGPWVPVGVDAEHDLALLRPASGDGYGSRRWSGCTIAGVGDRVYTAGYPIGVGPYLTDGYVSSIGDDYTYVSVDAIFGSSGSGIYNEDGKLVGMVQRIFLDRDRKPITFMLLSCNSQALVEFLRDVE